MLTLKHFLLRQQALSMYRHAIRASRSIPDSAARTETIAWIRFEFERSRDIHDVEMIKERLASIRRDMKELLPSIALSTGNL